MGVKKDVFVRDIARTIVASMLAMQKEWAQVIREVGPDVVGAVNLVWKNPRFPYAGGDRFSMDRVKELVSFARATAPDSEQLINYIIRALKAKYSSFFQTTPTDERNIRKELGQTIDQETMIKSLYEYLNKTIIKREFDRMYVTEGHKTRLASCNKSVVACNVVLKYLDSLDRGF